MLRGLGAVGAFALAGCAAVSDDPPRAPNVVLILADDLGWGELGCYGQTKIRTPRIDRLASEGLRFTQFYSGAPVCAPSRCTLLTGLHNGHTPIRDNREVMPEGQAPLPAESVTLAERLEARGYATGCFGKWGLGAPGSEGAPNTQGFDRFFGYLCQRQAHDYTPDHLWRDGERVELDGSAYSHDLIADAALAFVREHASESFFLYVPFTIPHLSLEVPEDSLAEYRGLWDDPPYDGKRGYVAHPTPRAAYAAMVTRMDRDVGRIVDLLGELDLADDTLVLFASDNGPTYDRLGGSDSDFFASAGTLRGRKGSVYEGGLRVPMIARWPGRVRVGVSEHVAALWDVSATLLDLVDGSAPSEGDGVSFANELAGREQRAHEDLYWELPGYSGQQALRFGSWKAVRRRMDSGNRSIELYDLASDPNESRDVAAEHPDVVVRAEARLAGARTVNEAFPLGKPAFR